MNAQIDAETGEQLSYKNILVKYVEPDYYENGTPNYKVDGTGVGTVYYQWKSRTGNVEKGFRNQRSDKILL